jgi:hypothetical protein
MGGVLLLLLLLLSLVGEVFEAQQFHCLIR